MIIVLFHLSCCSNFFEYVKEEDPVYHDNEYCLLQTPKPNVRLDSDDHTSAFIQRQKNRDHDIMHHPARLSSYDLFNDNSSKYSVQSSLTTTQSNFLDEISVLSPFNVIKNETIPKIQNPTLVLNNMNTSLQYDALQPLILEENGGSHLSVESYSTSLEQDPVFQPQHNAGQYKSTGPKVPQCGPSNENVQGKNESNSQPNTDIISQSLSKVSPSSCQDKIYLRLDDCVIFFIAYFVDSKHVDSNFILDVMKISSHNVFSDRVPIVQFSKYFELLATHQIGLSSGTRLVIELDVSYHKPNINCCSTVLKLSSLICKKEKFHLYFGNNKDYLALRIKEIQQGPVYQYYIAKLIKGFLFLEYIRSSNGFLLFNGHPLLIMSFTISQKMNSNAQIDISKINMDESSNIPLDTDINQRLTRLNTPFREFNPFYPNLPSKNSFFHSKSELNTPRNSFSSLDGSHKGIIRFIDLSTPNPSYQEASSYNNTYDIIKLPFLSTGVFFFETVNGSNAKFFNTPSFKHKAFQKTHIIWIEKNFSHSMRNELCLYNVFYSKRQDEFNFSINIQGPWPEEQGSYFSNTQIDRKIQLRNGKQEISVLFTLKQNRGIIYLVLEHPMMHISFLHTCFIARNHDNELFLDYRKADMGEIWFSFMKFHPSNLMIQQKIENRRYVLLEMKEENQFKEDALNSIFTLKKLKLISKHDHMDDKALSELNPDMLSRKRKSQAS